MNEELKNASMKELRMRKIILEKIIAIAEAAEDERIVEPQRQLAIIEKEIESRKNDPEDIVIGLDVLSLKAEKL